MDFSGVLNRWDEEMIIMAYKFTSIKQSIEIEAISP